MLTSGTQALLDMLAGAGVRYIFGNPGTTELPLIDALVSDRRIGYILGLQEVPVVAMADGFAQASRSLGVVNLHISCGLGNGMGMLYNAYRAGTPLLVTAGQQDRRLKFEEPILWSNMVDVTRGWTKWSTEVERVADLPSAVRRAVQTALTPPTGPVFLSLPLDVQTEVAELDLTPAAPLDPRVRPSAEALRRAAELLALAHNPAILAGGRVAEGGAVEALVAVAERLGAAVFSESGTTHGRLGFPPNHPLYAQALPLWSPDVREKLFEFDVVFVVGMDLLRQYLYHVPARAIPEHARLVHLEADPWQLGKNYPLELGLIGDPLAGLTELAGLLDGAMSAAAKEAARARGEARAKAHRATREALLRRVDDERAARPLSPLSFMSSLARAIPDDVAVVEEAVTTTNTYLERLGALKNTTGYFAHRGWALGWALGCALGVKLAWPDRPVLAIVGEGAAMYGIQALWTAARYRLGVTFVVPNNAQYQILKVGAQQLGLPAARSGRFEGLDLTAPEVDLVTLARSLGVESQRVTEPDELSQLVSESLAGDAPRLLDVPIQRGAPSRLSY
ncbi:MAG TPA: thiamine pyrophosphate-binding protein [Pirellulales bacterium]|jgi:benzoylformate decarboxylase|nr:thiamine pyrophosphate-binding protein [Pirellulales bacterium]